MTNKDNELNKNESLVEEAKAAAEKAVEQAVELTDEVMDQASGGTLASLGSLAGKNSR